MRGVLVSTAILLLSAFPMSGTAAAAPILTVNDDVTPIQLHAGETQILDLTIIADDANVSSLLILLQTTNVAGLAIDSALPFSPVELDFDPIGSPDRVGFEALFDTDQSFAIPLGSVTVRVLPGALPGTALVLDPNSTVVDGNFAEFLPDFPVLAEVVAPEPVTASLLCVSLAALALSRRRI